MNRIRATGIVLALLGLACGATRASPLPFNLDLSTPEVVLDTKRPPACTIVYLVTDTAANDMYAVRMQVSPLPDARAVDGHLPCPASVAPRVADRALTACANRAVEAKTCVYADMSREFVQTRSITATAENGSRCSSDQASYIGLACWDADGLDVCNIGCGATAQAAQAAAQERCLAKQQRACTSGATLPVLAP